MSEIKLRILDDNTIEETFKKQKKTFSPTFDEDGFSQCITLVFTEVNSEQSFFKFKDNDAVSINRTLKGLARFYGDRHAAYGMTKFQNWFAGELGHEKLSEPDSLIRVTIFGNPEADASDIGTFQFMPTDDHLFLRLSVAPEYFELLYSSFAEKKLGYLSVDLDVSNLRGIYREDRYHGAVRILFEDTVESIQGEFSPSVKANCFYESNKTPGAIESLDIGDRPTYLRTPVRQAKLEPIRAFEEPQNLTVDLRGLRRKFRW